MLHLPLYYYVESFSVLFIFEAHNVITIDKSEKHDSNVISLLSCKVHIISNIINTKTLAPFHQLLIGKITKHSFCFDKLCPLKQEWSEPLKSKTLHWTEKQTLSGKTNALGKSRFCNLCFHISLCLWWMMRKKLNSKQKCHSDWNTITSCFAYREKFLKQPPKCQPNGKWQDSEKNHHIKITILQFTS